MMHTKGKLYHAGDFALKDVKRLWTVKALGRMVGQTPVVFTIQLPDSSGKHDGYKRMILNRCMSNIAESFTEFSWSVFDNREYEIDKMIYPEFGKERTRSKI